MSRYLQKCEKEAARVGKCRATIEMQEGVISRLESLLEQAAVDQRRLAEAEALASRVQDANSVLQSGPDWEELSMLRDEVKDLRAAYQEREQDHRDLTNERIALTLRVEKSEANAIASNNEMLEVSRRCAREIAGLRAKLAEKDAQLMGGFGSVANMILAEMPAPPRLSTMEPMPSQYQPASRPASGARDSGLFGKRAEANLRDEPFESPAGAGADENDRNDANVASGVSAGSSDAKSLGEARSRPASRREGDADEAKAGSRPSSTQSRRPSTGARDASAAAGSGSSRSGSVAGSRPTTGGTRSLSRPATGERPK
jgi:hypothetical protein